MTTAKLIQKGESQTVRLPKSFKFDGNEVYISKIGDAIILLPKKEGWDSLFSSIDKFSDDFMSTRDQPQLEKREEPF